MALERRRRARERVQAATRGAVDDLFESTFPLLYAFLTAEKWPGDGAPRMPGTVLFFVDQGAYKAMLRDKDDPGVAFVTAGSLEGLLQALEVGLETGGLDWREDRQPGTGRKPGRTS